MEEKNAQDFWIELEKKERQQQPSFISGNFGNNWFSPERRRGGLKHFDYSLLFLSLAKGCLLVLKYHRRLVHLRWAFVHSVMWVVVVPTALSRGCIDCKFISWILSFSVGYLAALSNLGKTRISGHEASCQSCTLQQGLWQDVRHANSRGPISPNHERGAI